MNNRAIVCLVMSLLCWAPVSAEDFGNALNGGVAAVPSAPIVREFTVFFDFGKSDLTPEAREIVSEAVRTAKEVGLVRIKVRGYADGLGSQRYSQVLSERRAEAVKSEMIRLGMTDGDILTLGNGFSEPLVATGPGVREPMNRRAIIDLLDAPVANLAH
jgi:OmpA-OmpF porin, OOP family